MKLISYIKENGIRGTIEAIFQYQIDKYILKIIRVLFRKRPLQDIIVIESHNDFDCNGGAFYSYLIREGYNKKYKIVWLLKCPKRKMKDIPENVVCVPLFRPSVRKVYYLWVASFFTFDNYTLEKQREEQKFFYLTHGAGGLKNVKGLLNLPEWVDYILVQSEEYAPIEAEQYSLEYPNKKFVCLGYPSHDILLSNRIDEISKLTKGQYDKVILWMPTFRKGGGTGRNDSFAEYPMGIPLLSNETEYEGLNDFLKALNILLIIKIHPMQELEDLRVVDKSNIIVLTGVSVKELGVDNYRLMSCADALISDYSGVAYDFLQLDRPIAYIMDDANEYKLGFVVDDIDRLIAGNKIFTLEELKMFIKDVSINNDKYADCRKKLRDYIYKYHDDRNCERLAKFMGLTLEDENYEQ